MITLTHSQRKTLLLIQAGYVRFWEGSHQSFTFSATTGGSIHHRVANSLLSRGLARCRYNPGEQNGALEITPTGRDVLKQKKL